MDLVQHHMRERRKRMLVHNMLLQRAGRRIQNARARACVPLRRDRIPNRVADPLATALRHPGRHVGTAERKKRTIYRLAMLMAAMRRGCVQIMLQGSSLPTESSKMN